MNKPKTGMYLWFYAVLAFVLAIFGQTLLCGLLLAFVILTERDSWLTCQVIQALGLCFVNSVVGVVSSIFDLVTDYTLAGVSRFFQYNLQRAGSGNRYRGADLRPGRYLQGTQG